MLPSITLIFLGTFSSVSKIKSERELVQFLLFSVIAVTTMTLVDAVKFGVVLYNGAHALHLFVAPGNILSEGFYGQFIVGVPNGFYHKCKVMGK